MTKPILSNRLELLTMTSYFLEASIEDDRVKAESYLRRRLPLDWPDDKDLLSLRLRQLEEDPGLQPWLIRAMCRRDDDFMVGHIGFHTSPGPEYLEDWFPGAVEFGFSVFPAYRRQGCAREASIALMKWAIDTHKVPGFVLTISPENQPSQHLAASHGFKRIGSHVDEIDGIEDVLAREY